MSHILCSSVMVRKDLSWPVKLFFAKSQSKYGRIYQQRNKNFLLRWFLCVFGKGFLSELFGPKDKFFPDVMQNLGSSAVKNTYLHTKQLEKILTSRKTQTILTPHKTTGKRPNRQEEHLCFLRSRHGKNQFRGQGFMGAPVFRTVVFAI